MPLTGVVHRASIGVAIADRAKPGVAGLTESLAAGGGAGLAGDYQAVVRVGGYQLVFALLAKRFLLLYRSLVIIIFGSLPLKEAKLVKNISEKREE